MIAARRMLWIEREEADPLGVPVDFAVPVDEGTAWRCDVSIGWPHGPEIFRVLGFDAVQALDLAMEHTAIRLEISQYHREGSLYFDRPGEGYGLRLPPAP
jgi:hypothetical protein